MTTASEEEPAPAARDEADPVPGHQWPKRNIQRRNAFLDNGPLIHTSDALHQDVIGGNRNDVFAVVVHLVGWIEVIVAILPTEDPKDDLLHLFGEGFLQVPRRDVALIGQDVSQPLHGHFLPGQSLFEISFLQLALTHQDVSQEVVQPPYRGVRMHDLAALEHDDDGLSIVFQCQQAGLALHADQLKDVRKREVSKRSPQRHGFSQTRIWGWAIVFATAMPTSNVAIPIYTCRELPTPRVGSKRG